MGPLSLDPSPLRGILIAVGSVKGRRDAELNEVADADATQLRPLRSFLIARVLSNNRVTSE